MISINIKDPLFTNNNEQLINSTSKKWITLDLIRMILCH